MNGPLKLTIVTVTFNGEAVISEFMESLFAQTLQDWALIVVDNASSDATLAHLERWSADPRVEVIALPENTGAAEGNNVGLARAMELGAPLLLFTNNDVSFGPDTLDRLVNEMTGLPPGGLSATLIYDEQIPRIWYNGGCITRLGGVRCVHRDRPLDAHSTAPPYPTEYAPTTFLLFNREVIEAVGQLDASYFAYWEDADYLWRVRRAGFGLWVSPTVVVTHKVSASSGGGGSAYSHQHYFRNQMLFARKYFGWTVMGYTAVTSTLRILARRAIGRDNNALTRAKLRGLAQGIRYAAGRQARAAGLERT